MRAALRRMDVRLFLSHALVALIGVVAVALVVRLTAPGIFDAEMQRRGMAGGAGVVRLTSPRPRTAFSARSTSRWPSASSSPSWPLPSWPRWPPAGSCSPSTRCADATRKMAGGTYGVEVPVPAVTELGALAEDVNRLGAALAETEQRRAALVSDLAHELRTPLTTVRGFLEGLTDGVFEPTPDVLADLTEEVARLQRLVGDLNVLSRADEGTLPLDLARRDVAQVAASVAGRLAPQFADKGVVLEVDAPEAVPALIDGDRVTQLLTNVVGNALAYTEPGGRVTVAVRRAGAQVTVEVVDTGRGIAADELPRVFDRFHRADRSGSGTGVGLTIARSIARAHGGDVTAESAGLGDGSTFVVRLPVDGPQSSPSPGLGPDAGRGRGALTRILSAGRGPSSSRSLGCQALPWRLPVPSIGRSACGPEPSWAPLRCWAPPLAAASFWPLRCWAICPSWEPSCRRCCTCSWRWSPVQTGSVWSLAANAALAGTMSATARAPPAMNLVWLRITHLLLSSFPLRV